VASVTGEPLGLAVDGARRREHEVADPVLEHRLDDGDQRAQVVRVVVERLRLGLADGLRGGEMDHARDGSFALEDAAERRSISAVEDMAAQGATADRLEPGEHAAIRVREVVDEDRLEPALDELDRRMRADVAGAARHEDLLTRQTLPPPLPSNGQPFWIVMPPSTGSTTPLR
jgi:hypothetical protein